MSKSDLVTNGSRRHVFVALAITILLGGLVLLPVSAPEAMASTGQATVDADWGQMPLHFIPNQGQSDPAVSYCVQGSDKVLFFTSSGLTYALGGGEEAAEGWCTRLEYLGANSVRPEGSEQTDTAMSYLRGPEDDWITSVPVYSSIRYSNLWTGIDLVYSGTQNQLKQEFLLQPGADPADIRLSYVGASLALTGQGDLEISTPAGDFTDTAPIAYQMVDGDRVEVSVGYALDDPSGVGADETTVYGFSLGCYDPTLPVVIDPSVLIYCGYIGGGQYDEAYGIAVDSSGCAYVTGCTLSSAGTFPETAGSFDESFESGYDAYIAKVAADGSGLTYCTYLGGSGDDYGRSIAVDSSGCAYVSGWTSSSESSFPIVGSLDTGYDGSTDAYVAKISADGSALIYCGYLGGDGGDYGYGIAVDSNDCAYVTGTTSSTSTTFPETTGAFGTVYNGGWDVFVAKVNAAGSALEYCGYIGGSGSDNGMSVAVDSDECAYVTGYTDSSTFPTVGSLDTSYNNNTDAFVAKVNAAGSALSYCGYIGGNLGDFGSDIAVDSGGCAYVVGYTDTTETDPVNPFPVTVGPDTSHNGGMDVFLAKVDAAGSALGYCGYIGGSEDDFGQGITVDSNFCAYVTGFTYSTESTFPVVGDLDSIHNGARDAFVTKVKTNGSALFYSGYIGGNGDDLGLSIAVDSKGCAFVTGDTYSSAAYFPVVGDLDPIYNNNGDAFVAKVKGDVPTVTGVNPAAGPTTGGNLVTITGSGFEMAWSVTFDGVAPSGGFEVKSNNEMTVQAPPHAAGTVRVKVTSAYGSSEDTSADDYTYFYVAPPAVTGLSPSFGPTSGGTSVIIYGSGFDGATSVTFGGIAATSYAVNSSSQITAQAPAHAAGAVQVKVTSGYGSSADTAADDFSYYTQPGLTRYEQDNPSLDYQGSWTKNVYSPYAASGWSYSYANGAASLNIAFTGTSLDWITRITPWSGIAKVVLDAGKATEKVEFVDTWHWTDLHKQKVYSTGTLAYGPHTLSIYWTGLKRASSWYHQIYADAFDIVGTLTNASAAPAQELKKIDDKDSGYCTYTPDWSHWDNSGYWAAYLDTYAFTDKQGDKLTVTFTGTYLSWVAATSNTKGKAKVTLDGGTPQTVDLYSPATLWKQSVYNTGVLAYGTHTLVIECLHEKRPYSWWYTIDADRFDIL